ncbi:UNVERIFIED_CONTAM: hypothetical protein RMT77_005919 [Armadillidium vulgare]
MEIPINQLPPGDPRLVDAIVGQLKSKGIFDKFRKECLADVDTKPAFLNLRQRVDGQVKKFLDTKTWRSDLNKNQLRDGVRKNIQESGILDTGIDAIINQVVNPKIKPLILPLVEDTVYSFLQVEKPKREIQEFEFQTQLAIQDEGKHYYEHQMPVPPPPLPPYSLYQDYPPPPNVYGNERFEEHPKLPQEREIKPNVAEDSSISSESHLSAEVIKNEHKEVPPVHEVQSTAPPEILPMETDAISSGEDDILGRTSPDTGSPFKEKIEEEFKMEEDNAVDSFDSARKEAEAVTSAVKKMSLGRDENVKSLSGSQDRRETSVSLPIFDNKSLDSISSNSSGLSLSPSPSKSASGLQESQSQMQHPESTSKSVDELRSTQSTPLVDEKSVNESISSENSKSWVPYTLPKEMPSEERITIASFGAFGGGEPGRFIEGASPVSADDSQSSLEKEEIISKESIKSSKTDERSEGELTNTDSNSSIASPESSKDGAAGSTVISSSAGKDSIVKMLLPKNEESFKSVREGSKEKEKSKSKDKHDSKNKDRHRRSSKYDDHYSHHEKEKHHRRDKDDDKDKDKHGKGHHHHSGTSSRIGASSDGGSKEKRERSHEKSSDYKSHSHSKSHHSRSHSSRSHSHSKSHSSSNSESSSRSKHSESNHKSSHNDKDHHKSSHSDKKHKSSHISSDKGSEKSSSNLEKNIKEKTLSKSQNEGENKLSEKVSNKNSSVSSQTKVKKADSVKIKPCKLIEDDMFALHLTNSNKNAVLPKPSNSVIGVKKGQTSKVGDSLKSSSNILKDSNIKSEDKKKTTEIGKEVVDSVSDEKLCKEFKDGKSNEQNNLEKLNNSKDIKNEKEETGKTNKEEIEDLKSSKENLKITIKKDKNDTLKVIKNKSKSNEIIERKISPSKANKKTSIISPKKKLHVNGTSKVALKMNKLTKRKVISSSDSSTSSESESESSDSSTSNYKRKSRHIRKKIPRTQSSTDSDSSSDSSDESESDKETKLSNILVNATEVLTANNTSVETPKLKTVTIPLVSLNSEDIEGYKQKSGSSLVKNISENSIGEKYFSDSDTFREVFGSSSDDDSGIEFEGFTSNSETSSKNSGSVNLFKKVELKTPQLSKIRNNQKPIPFRPKSKKVKSQEYVVLCDSSDSSDMEVSLIKFCEKPYIETKNKNSPKLNDFEGFDGDSFEDTSGSADQKLKDYLAKFSFGSSIQLNDFLSMDSEEEIGEESTVFFTKKDASKSVIEEITAKQTIEEITEKQTIEEITEKQTIEEISEKQTLEISNITEDKSTPVVGVLAEQNSDDKTNDIESNTFSVFSTDSSKPFKKRKLSSIAVDEVSSPTHSPKVLKTDESKSITGNPNNKDIILNTYSLLTPEEDRTSSRDYEVDLGQRGTSYSPLSPASDSSSEVQEALNAKNKAENEATPDKSFCKATSSSNSS